MAPAAAAMAMIARLVLVAASAGAAAKPLQHLDPTQEVETRLAALLPTLSVEQLMTQTLHLWTKVNMDMINETYSKTGVGAAYSNHPTGDSSCDTDPACNLKARLALNRELMKTCGIPVTFVAESLHSPWITQGVIMPMPVALGSSWNNSLLTEVGAAIAAEATACASTRGFSPEINVCTDPRFGRTQENFGADAQHVAAMGVAITVGLQGGMGNASTPGQYIPTRSLSCEAKHLAAYGSGDMDGAPAEMSEMTLRDIYLKPWKKFFAAGGRGAMLSHNSINGIPAHMHKKIMTDIIRGEWNHSDVFFASDAGDIDHISGFHIAGDPAVLSITAGMDQALTGTAFTTLADLVKSGKLDRKVLERAAASTLREKIAGRLFDKKYDGVSDGEWGNTKLCRAAADGGVLDAPEHRAIAKQAAQEGTVMLVNGRKQAGAAGSSRIQASAGIAAPGFSLPLTAAKWKGIGQIAIVGPNANISKTVLGSYVSAWGEYPAGTANAEIYAATVLSSARAAVPTSTKIVSAAVDSDNLIDETEMGANQTRLIAEAVEAANASDVVVAVLGDSTKTCGEGTDRISLDLPGVQMQLLAALISTGKPIILVLVHGRPVTFGPDNHLLDGVDVVLATWIGGEETGPATWSIINGEFNPSGRLPMTWPRTVGYVGTHADSRFGPAGLWQGDYQGMGWRDNEPSEALFEYGFGLSFGTPDAFDFKSKKSLTVPLSAATFTVDIGVAKNASNPGGTVVQLYFSQSAAQAVRPKLMLLAFAKVDRATTDLVTLTIPLEELGYFHPLTDQTSVDPGKYTLSVGRSAGDLSATTRTLIVTA